MIMVSDNAIGNVFTGDGIAVVVIIETLSKQ